MKNALFILGHCILFGIGIGICSCRPTETDRLEQALKASGPNRPELEKVLAHYGSV